MPTCLTVVEPASVTTDSLSTIFSSLFSYSPFILLRQSDEYVLKKKRDS